jgi:hypothetical protein
MLEWHTKKQKYALMNRHNDIQEEYVTEDRPRYTSMHKYHDEVGGYAIWVPGNWYRIPMAEGHHGVIFAPDPNDINTSFLAEKTTLPFKVSQKDFAILRKGFQAGLESLEDAVIESQDEDLTSTLKILSGHVTFTEDGVRRKRWVRTAYWGEGQLTLIAQGATEEAYAYYEGMFYNAMMTVEIT